MNINISIDIILLGACEHTHTHISRWVEGITSVDGVMQDG